MLVSFTIRLSVNCRGCQTSVPVNGVAPGAPCYHCGEANPFDASWWTNVIEPGYFGEALGLGEGEGKTVNALGGKYGIYRLAYGKRTPRCQVCKGPDLDLAGLGNMLAQGRCFCPACGQSIRIRPADELARTLNARALFLVGETTLSGSEQALQRKSQPVLFQCMGCGGALKVDGSSRAVACEHCGNSNYLPDGLWQQLNPVPKEQVFFLICDYDQAGMRDAQLTDDDAREAYAKSGPLDADVIARLLVDPEDDVRVGLAQNPNLPWDAIVKLAQDEDDDVREAIAKNPITHPQILAHLATDQRYNVRAAVAGNPNADAQALWPLREDSDSDVEAALCTRVLPPELIEPFSQSSRYEIRRVVAKNQTTPLEILWRLASDDDSDVQNAAKERLGQLQAQGVDVNAGRGLFKKLFGG